MARRKGHILGMGQLNPRVGFFAQVSGVFRDTSDVKGLRRFTAEDYRENVWDSAPALPSLPAAALLNRWEFKNLYDVNTTNTWKQTASGSGTALTVQDTRGGRAKATNGATDNNYYFYESIYEIAKLSSGKHLIITGSIEIADVDQADWFWGLSARLASGDLFDNRVDSIGFYGADGSANINCEARKNGTATADTAIDTLSDATEMYFGIHVIGTTSVYFYTENEAGYRIVLSSGLPDDEEMCVSFGCRNGQAVANSLTVGQITLVQDR